ncbi:MAG TPA: hypothetical protein PLK29_02940 [Chiayiivirga sp.]|nr:hypothetical protein [Chiayiivirga sp.]
MLNTVIHGRQQARKALLAQVLAVAVVALALLAASPAHALAAALGGGALALGGWLSAWVALGGQTPAAAGLALGRLVTGLVLKWALLLAALLLGLAVWHLPPAALVGGVLVALLAQVLAMLRR